jgi:hypothetical protein
MRDKQRSFADVNLLVAILVAFLFTNLVVMCAAFVQTAAKLHGR